MSSDLFYRQLIDSYIDRHFVDRPWLEASISTALDDPDCRFVLLTGEPGSGKSAFMAWLAKSSPDALRYFIRGDGAAPESAGDVHSFLLRVGHQFAASHPHAFQLDGLRLVVEQQAEQLQAGGRMVGIKVEDLLVSPFARTSTLVTQQADQVHGEMVGVEAARVVADERLLEPSNLQELALFAPAWALARAEPDRRVLVLVDALDELRFRWRQDDRGAPTVLDWLELCPELPPNMRVVVSARPDDDLLKRFRFSQRRWVREVRIDESMSEVQDDLRRYTAAIGEVEPEVNAAIERQGVVAGVFWEELARRSDGNFQYASAVVRAAIEASRHGRDAELHSIIKLDELPTELDELYAFFLELVRSGVRGENVVLSGPEPAPVPAWTGLYMPLLALLTVAQEPVTTASAAALLGIEVEEMWVVDALSRLEQFLDRVGSGYRFYHSSLQEFLVSDRSRQRDPALHVDAVHWHGRIAATSVKRYGKGASWLSADPYTRRYLPVHAASAGTLDDLVHDPGFLIAADIDMLLRAIPALTEPEARLVGWVYESAARRMSGLEADQRLSYLEFVAHQHGVGSLMRALGEADLERAWSVRWLRWIPLLPHHRVGRFGIRPVRTLLVTPDPPQVVMAEEPSVVRIVDYTTGLVEHEFDIPASEGQYTAINVGKLAGQLAAVCGTRDGQVLLWDPVDGQQTAPPLWGLAGFGAPNILAVGGRIPSAITVLDSIPREVRAVAVADVADRHLVAAGDEDGTVYVWEMPDGIPVAQVNPFQWGAVSTIAIHEYQGVPSVIVGDDYGRVAVIHLGSGPILLGSAPLYDQKPEEVIEAFHSISTIECAMIEDRFTVITCAEDGEIHFWDGVDASPIGEAIVADEPRLADLAVTQLTSIAMLPNGLLAAGGRNLSLYSIPERRHLLTVPQPHDSSVSALAWCEYRGADAVMSCGGDQAVNIWPLSDLLDHTQPSTTDDKHKATVFRVGAARVRDRSYIISGGDDGTVRCWDADTGGSVVPPLRLGDMLAKPLAVATVDEDIFVAVGGFADNSFALWTLREPGFRQVATLRGHQGEVTSIVLAQIAGRLTAITGSNDHTIRVWDIESRRCWQTLTGHISSVSALTLLPPKEMNEPSPQDRRGWFGRGSAPKPEPAASPRLLSGSLDGTVRIWDIRTGTALGEPMLDPEGVLEPADEPEPEEPHPPSEDSWTEADYRQAAADARASADRALWSAEKSRQQAGYPPDPEWRERMGGLYRPINALATRTTPEGTVAYAASVGGLRVWHLETFTPGDWIPLGRGAINDMEIDTSTNGSARIFAVNQAGELRTHYLEENHPDSVVEIGTRLFDVVTHPNDTNTVVLAGGGLAAIKLSHQ